MNLLGWPESLFMFFCTILWKILNEFLANPVDLPQKSLMYGFDF